MSLRPVIFISAVSKELKFARQLVADTLISLGYEPDWQDIFGTEAGDLTAMLRHKVDAASAVVQLVGKSYGAESAAPLPGFGRVSYTQYEARYALSRGKKVYYLFLGPDFPAEPSAPAEPEELRALQAAYRESIRATGALRHPAATPTELENKILRLRNDLASLRRRTRQWAAALTAVAMLTLGGVTLLIAKACDGDDTLRAVEQKLAETAEHQNRLLEGMRLLTAEVARNVSARGSPDDARTAAATDEKLGLPPGTLERELPAFAAKLLEREDIDPLDRARALLVQKKYAEAEAAALTALRDIEPDAYPAPRIAALETAAYAALEQFHHADALRHYRAAAALTSKARDPVEWILLHNEVAHSLYETGDFAGAASLLRTVVPVASRIFGAETRDTLGIRSTLAQALKRTGQTTEAEAEDREVLAIRKRVLGPEDPDTLTSRSNVANYLMAAGQHEVAKSEHEAVLAIRKRVHGPEHPGTLSSITNVAVALSLQGQHAPALEMYRQVLAACERAGGADAPESIRSRLNVAAGLGQLQRWREALAEAQTALEASTRVLGKEHPDTIKAQAMVDELRLKL